MNARKPLGWHMPDACQICSLLVQKNLKQDLLRPLSTLRTFDCIVFLC